MKKIIMCALGCALYGAVHAQGIVIAGAHITTHGMVTMAVEGSMVVTGNWQNDHGAGVFDHSGGASVVTMRGQSPIITGVEPTQFGTLIADGFGTLFLGCDITIRDSLVLVTSGVDLMGKSIAFIDSSILVGENETVFVGETNGVLGGSLWTTGMMTYLQSCSIGNLGLSLVSDQNTLVTLVRRHTPIGLGGGVSSIARSYSVYTQDTTVVFDAVFSYLPHELGGITPDSLVVYASMNNVVWYHPHSLHDPIAATVSVVPVQFTTLTLAHSLLSPLAYDPGTLQGICESEVYQRTLSWTIPQNHQYAWFVVEKSIDLINWIAIGVVANTDTSVFAYSFVDTEGYTTPWYYRIGGVDYNGAVTALDGYIVHSMCEVTTPSVSLYPNPNRGMFSVSIPSLYLPTTLRVYDIYGRSVFTQAVHTHLNTVQIAVSPGTYVVVVGDEARMMVVY